MGLVHYVNIKECYPFNCNITRVGQALVWESSNEKEIAFSSFRVAYQKLMMWQNDYVTNAFDIYEENQTLYIVMKADEGVTFDKDNADNLADILKTVKLLTHVVGNYHKNGYLHLDIKPINFLVYPRPSVHIILFDMDTVIAEADIKSGKIRCVSYSQSCAAPEQKQGNIAKVCPATDIFAIGAILFEKIFGRQVQSFDMGIFADWDFENNLLNTINPKIKRILRNIFRKTLAANVKRRYQNTDELLIDLDEAIKTATQEKYLISDNIISEINFVGREVDLQKIDELFVTKESLRGEDVEGDDFIFVT
jgi:serine/threonine protein kinase